MLAEVAADRSSGAKVKLLIVGLLHSEIEFGLQHLH